MKLTQRTIDSLTLPADRAEAIYFDDDIAGFGLRLRDGGSRTWVFQYKLGAKHRRLTLGRVSALPLAKARDTASDLYAMVRLGRDPAADRAEGRARAAETFEAALKPFLDRQRGKLRPRTYVEVERHLLVNCKPLHGLPLAKIELRTIAGRLTAIAQDNGPVTANRVRASLSAFYSWAMGQGLADKNPVIGTDVAEEKARDRVLSADELREIWAALPDSHYGTIVKLLALTGQRRDEISSLRWSEIDRERGVIRFPKERTKNKTEHVLPMAAEVRALIEAQPERVDRDFVFGEGQGGFSGWGHCKVALDERILANRKARAEGSKVKPMSPWRLHDLRRTVATGMADLGVAPHVIEAILNHISGHKAGVAGVYNRSTYEAEKAAALALWGDHLMNVVAARPAKIVPLRAAN